MIKQRKIGMSLLASVLALVLLVSVCAGLGISTVAADDIEWDYDYAVTPNTTDTTNQNYYNAANLDGIDSDFQVYGWTVTNQDYSAAVSLSSGYPKAVSNTTVRQNASVSSSYRNAGYLDLQYAGASLPVALTHKEVAEEFYLEMDIVVGSSWSVSKGIMIAPAGDFALVNSETVADKGIFISVLRGNAGIAGAIDPSTAATLSTVTISTASGGAFNDPPTKNEDNKVRAGLYTWAADSSLPAVNGNSGNDLVTYCVQVQDGVVSVWTKNDTSKVLSVALSDDYKGGQISFVSTSQNYNAFAGMRLKEYVESDNSWEYDYAVKPNTTDTTNQNYYNAANLDGVDKDFAVYAWNVANDYVVDSTSYPNYTSAVPLATDNWPRAVSANSVRQNASVSSGYRNAGYLDLQIAQATKPVAMTHKEPVKEFYLEMDIVVSDSWGVSKGIMIAPAGEFALVNSETVADKGIYISLLRGGAGIGGTIDPSTAASLSTVTVANVGTSGVFNDQPMKFEETKVGNSGLYTFTNDTSLLAVKDSKKNDLVTYCVQVQDGVVSVWTKDNTSNVLSVALSDDYKGGQISFVSTGQNYNAFAGMRLKKLVTQTAWSYAVTQNTTDASYAVEDFADIATDFTLYNWNIAASGGKVAYYAPTLTAGFPKAVDAATVTVPPYSATSNESARNFGYMDIAEVKSGTVSAMTHGKTLDAKDEFLLEMDFVVRKSIWSAPKGLMIAPAGEFAVSNDGNAANEKGIYIAFDAGSNLSITGAVEADGACTTGTAAPGTSWGQQPFVNASTVFCLNGWGAALDTYTGTVADDGNKAPYTVTAGIVTVCVEVRDGIMTVWLKHKPAQAVSVVLSEAYMGGNVSYVSSSAWDHAFVGMRLTEHDRMAEGSAVMNGETGIITVKGKTDYEQEVGSLTVTAANGQIFLPQRIGFQDADVAQSKLYRVTESVDLTDATVACSFVQPTLDDVNIATFGVGVNPAKNKGLRFISRFTRTVGADGKEYVSLGGKNYEIQDYGVLYAIGNDLTLDKDNGVKYSHKSEYPCHDICAEYVEMAATVYDLAGTYYDATGTMIYNDLQEVTVSARAYVVIIGDNEEAIYLYGEQKSTSYINALNS